jgi:hypothetical protein
LCMEFDISFTDREITPWGGMVFLKQMLQKIGFRKIVDENVDLPIAKSNRGYKASTILESFITSIWCGANRFLHTEVTRHEPYWVIFLIGNAPQGRTPINGFFPNLTKQKTSELAIIFTLGFLTTSSLTILL